MKIIDIIKDYFSPITCLFKTQREKDEGWIKRHPPTPEYKKFLETYTGWVEDDVICIAIRNELPHLKCKLRTKGYDINVKVSGNVRGDELETVATAIHNRRSAGVGMVGAIGVTFPCLDGSYRVSNFDIGDDRYVPFEQ